MRAKKVFICIILGLMIACIFGKLYAREMETVKVGILEDRKTREDGTQHAYKRNGKVVWKLVKFNDDGKTFTYDNAIYCLKADKGFAVADENGVYNDQYDKTEDLRNPDESSNPAMNEAYYNQVLWILDNLYIPYIDGAEEDKALLLKAAGITDIDVLDDDDIEVVQQLAIWYFTNADDPVYHTDSNGKPLLGSIWKRIKNNKIVTEDYKEIGEYGSDKQDIMNKLYEYLITSANENAQFYDENHKIEPPVSLADISPVVSYEDDKVILGPYKINKNNNYPVEYQYLSETQAIHKTGFFNQYGKEITDYTILDSNKNRLETATLESMVGQEFYIEITNQDIQTVRFRLKAKYRDSKMEYWSNNLSNTVQQLAVITEKNSNLISQENEVNVNITGSYQIQIEKVDGNDSTKKLSGAEFDVTMPDGTVQTKVTDENGIITLGPIDITYVGLYDQIKITETKTPEGYRTLGREVDIQVTKQVNGIKYEAIGAQIISEEQEGVTAGVENNVVKVVIPNEKITGEYQLQLEKVDKKTGANLRGAEFNVTMPDGTITTETVDDNGRIDFTPITITDANTIDTIKIRETKAPDGYCQMLEEATINVSKELVGEEYHVSEISIGENSPEGFNATVENNIIKVVVPNEEREGSYQVQLEKVDGNDSTKKLSGAEFNVTMPDGTQKTVVTSENGTVNLDPIEITDTSKVDSIKVVETKAPTGYKKLMGDVTFNITKSIELNKYTVSDIKIASGVSTGISMTVENNVVKITIRDEKIKTPYNLQVVKEDTNGNFLAGAKFKIEKLNGSTVEKSYELVTGDDGIITLPNEETVDSEVTTRYRITETMAPNKYVENDEPILIDIISTLENDSYKISHNLISGEAKNISLDGNTVKVEVENKQFDISLRKSITKLNGQVQNRLPETDSTELKLKTDTTAKYNHDKTPLVADTNQEIEYTFSIFNEGEVPGYAGEIIDYLPAGIEYISGVETEGKWNINEEKQLDGTTKLVITNLEKKILQAYDDITLDKVTFTIKCKVTATKGETEQVLTNIAEISDYRDEKGNIVIDRDSEQANFPENSKNNDYSGNGQEENYIPGQEDDDDFEKVVLSKATGEYGVQIEKVDKDNNKIKLSNAEFYIELPNGTSVSKQTDENGILDLGKIAITDISEKDIIRITETKAPDQYNMLLDGIDLSIEKIVKDGKYEAGSVDITYGEAEDLNAVVENNVVKVTVPNEKISGTYNLQLEKVDKDDNYTKLAGAEFEITLPDGTVQTKTTDENGILNIDSIKIDSIAANDTIKITETKAPSKYNKIIDEVTLEVEKELRLTINCQ